MTPMPTTDRVSPSLETSITAASAPLATWRSVLIVALAGAAAGVLSVAWERATEQPEPPAIEQPAPDRPERPMDYVRAETESATAIR